MYHNYHGPEPESPARPDAANASQERAPGAQGERGERMPPVGARPGQTPRERAYLAPGRWADVSLENAPAPGADAPQGSAPGARRGRADASGENAPGTSGSRQARPAPPPYRPSHPSGSGPGVTPPGVGTQRLSGLVPKRNNEPAQHKRRSELRAVAEAMGPSGSENPGGRNIEPPPAYDDPRLRATVE